jgi:hypothetical protein
MDIESGSTSSHSVKNFLRKRLLTCRKETTDLSYEGYVLVLRRLRTCP